MNTKTSLFKKSLIATSIATCLFAGTSFTSIAAEKAAEEKDVEVIEVVGTRAAWAKSLMTKKQSSVIIESINATDIGKMPDANIAESLQRLTGVQISRNNGDGSNIQIRGMSKNLLLLNNEVMLTGKGQSEGGMGSFEEIPAELVGEVKVYKASAANLIEGGMGGTVDIITRKPLSLDGFTLAGSIKAGSGSNTLSEIEPNTALVIGNNWDDKFGALLSLSSNERYKTANYALNHRQPYANVQGNAPWRIDVLEQGERVDYPEIYAPTQGIEEKTRFGAALSLQYRFNDSLDFSFDWMHNELQTATEEVKALFHMDRSSETILEPGVTHTGRVIDNALFTLGRQENQTVVQDAANEADNYKFEADWIINDSFRATLNVSYGESHELSLASYADTMSTQNSNIPFNAEQAADPSLRSPLNPNGVDTFDMYWSDTGEGLPSIGLVDFDLGDPNYHYFKSAWAGGGERESESTAIKLDFEYEVDFGVLQTVTFGVRSSSRDAVYQGWQYNADYTSRGATRGDDYGPFYRYQDAGITDPGLGYSILDVVRFADEPNRVTIYDDFYGLSDQYGRSMDLAAISTAGMRNPHQWLADYTGAPVSRVNDPLNKWSVEQDVQAVYLMADFVADIGDMYLTANIGGRYVQTDILVNQQTALPDTPTQASHSWNGVLDESGFVANPYNNKFNDFLPSFSLNLEVTEDMFIKLAASKTMARQNLNQMAAAFNKSYSQETIVHDDGSTEERQNFIGGSRGNPELKPDRTTAVDLSYEWYFDDESLVSAAIFYKDMTSVVISSTQEEEHFNGDGVTTSKAVVNTNVNSPGGEVKGLELALQHVFDNGFGFNTNYTYSDGKAEGVYDENQVTQLSLPGLSEHSANAGVFYDQDGLRANLSYNWRSEQRTGMQSYHGVNTDIAAVTPTYSDAYGQVDASIGYEIDEHFTITAEVTNLFAEDTNQYLGTDATDQFWNFYEGEARYFVGVAFKL